MDPLDNRSTKIRTSFGQ